MAGYRSTVRVSCSRCSLSPPFRAKVLILLGIELWGGPWLHDTRSRMVARSALPLYRAFPCRCSQADAYGLPSMKPSTTASWKG